jgi:uncharacterized protein
MIELEKTPHLGPAFRERLGQLHQLLDCQQPGIIAVSGGLDSRFLASLAKAWNLDYRTAFVSGPHLTPLEARQGRNWAQRLGLPSRIGAFSPLETPEAAGNEAKRCYFCKRALIARLRGLFSDQPGLSLLDGSHASDAAAYRPGIRALAEEGVHSPLAAAGLTKADLRHCARFLGLEAPDQPSRACLMTRFDYGLAPDREQMETLGRAEDELAEIGLTEFRIRRGRLNKAWLQVDHREAGVLNSIEDRVRDCLDRHGLSRAELVITRGVSGFFDHQFFQDSSK